MVPSVFVEKHERMIQLKATKEEYLTNLRAMAAESEMHRKTLAEEEEVRVTVGLILKLTSFKNAHLAGVSTRRIRGYCGRHRREVDACSIQRNCRIINGELMNNVARVTCVKNSMFCVKIKKNRKNVKIP